MGGRPVMALNIVNFPSRTLDHGILRDMLLGGAEKVAEAGAVLAGGHSVDDPEPKYGMAVTGVVHPERVLTNSGAKPGDALILTKPLGTGVIFNANREGKYPADALEKILPPVAELNRTAMETALKFDVHGLTDITGFGFAGHALEMAVHSGVRMNISFSALPLYDGAVEMYASGTTTGTNEGNRRICGGRLEVRAGIGKEQSEILVDPQTSGGLLISLPEEQAKALLGELQGAGVSQAAIVGNTEAAEPAIVVEN